MGLFARFKMLFNKSVMILPHQRADMVSFVRLKNGSLKIGSEIIVDENFNFVIVHYNKVCDVLRCGTFKVDDVNTPKLFKYSKALFTKKGMFTPKFIKADAYFINLNPFRLNTFKTPERIVVHDRGQKIKIKLEGTFTLKVVDSEKVMTALCNDYAVITNKKAMKEIRATIGFDVSKILNKKDFSLQDYLQNKDKIVEVLNEQIGKFVEGYGLEVKEFFINSVIVPKKNIVDKPKEEVLGGESNIDIVKLVEQRLNALENNFSTVEKENDASEAKEGNNFSGAKTSIDSQGNMIIDVGSSGGQSSSSGSDKSEGSDVFSMPYSNAKDLSMFSGVEQKAPELFENERVKEKSEKSEVSDFGSEKRGISERGISESGISDGRNKVKKIGRVIGAQNGEGSGAYENETNKRLKNEKSKYIENDDGLGKMETNLNGGYLKEDKEKKSNLASENKLLESEIKEDDNVISGIVDYFANKKKSYRVEFSKDFELFKVKVGKERAEAILSLNGKKFKKCKNCGEVIDDKAKFCSKCGKSTEELVACPCCGAKNFPNAKVCCVCKSEL